MDQNKINFVLIIFWGSHIGRWNYDGLRWDVKSKDEVLVWGVARSKSTTQYLENLKDPSKISDQWAGMVNLMDVVNKNMDAYERYEKKLKQDQFR